MIRTLLLNRVTLTFAALAVVVAAWNLHVIANDDGRLAGRVVDASGQPVAGAEVVISELSLISLNVVARTTTDEQGRFRFLGHGRHALVLAAEKPGVGRSPRREIRLYFRNQNRDLAEPVVLHAQAGSVPPAGGTRLARLEASARGGR